MLYFIFIIIFSGILALLNILYYSRGYTFVFDKYFPKKSWVSNIVGNPYALDRLFTMFLGPFPELNDFNAVLTNLSTSKAFVFHGKVPLARYWGLQLFLPGAKTNSSKQTLTDFQIVSDEGERVWDRDYSDHEVQRSSKEYTIVVCSEQYKPTWASNWVELGESKTGKFHLVFRGYCPFHGAPFATPKMWVVERDQLKNYSNIQDFFDKNSGRYEQIDEEERVFGPWSVVYHKFSERDRLFRTVVLDLSIFFFLSMTFVTNPFSLALLVLGTVVCSYLLYEVVLKKRAEERYIKMVRNKYQEKLDNPELKNKCVFLPEPQGSLAGHPNHQYFTIPYDATNDDVIIEGFKDGPFRYTSVQCYQWNSLPLPQFHFDSSMYVSESSPEKYVVRLSTKPVYHPRENVVNVSSSPKGLVLIRLIFPRDDSVINEYVPTVRPIERNSPTY